MSIDGGNVNVKLTTDSTGLNTGLKQAESSIKKLAITIGGLALAKKFFDMGAGAVSLAADLEQTSVSFTTLYGSSKLATAQLDVLRKFAAKTPFQFKDLTKATKTLLTFQVRQGKVNGLLKTLGNLSQGNSQKLNTITEAYGQMNAAGKVGLDQLRRLTEVGVPVLQALADEYGTTTAAVYDMISAGEVGIPELTSALEALGGEGGMFGNSLAHQSETLTGVISTLEGGLTDLSTVFGEALAPAIKSTAKGLVGLVTYINALDRDAIKTGVRIVTLGTGVIALGVGLIKLPAIITLVKTAIAALNATMALNPWGAAAIAIGLLITTLGVLIPLMADNTTQTELAAIAQERLNLANEQSNFTSDEMARLTKLNEKELRAFIRQKEIDIGRTDRQIARAEKYGHEINENTKSENDSLKALIKAAKAKLQNYKDEAKAREESGTKGKKLYKEYVEVTAKLDEGKFENIKEFNSLTVRQEELLKDSRVKIYKEYIGAIKKSNEGELKDARGAHIKKLNMISNESEFQINQLQQGLEKQKEILEKTIEGKLTGTKSVNDEIARLELENISKQRGITANGLKELAEENEKYTKIKQAILNDSYAKNIISDEEYKENKIEIEKEYLAENRRITQEVNKLLESTDNKEEETYEKKVARAFKFGAQLQQMATQSIDILSSLGNSIMQSIGVAIEAEKMKAENAVSALAATYEQQKYLLETGFATKEEFLNAEIESAKMAQSTAKTDQEKADAATELETATTNKNLYDLENKFLDDKYEAEKEAHNNGVNLQLAQAHMSHIAAQLMIGVNTAAAIMGVWTSMAAAGPPGWAVAGVMSGVIGALGVSQHIAAGVAYGLNISKLSSSRMADGGIVQGGSSAGDMVPTMMNAEEMVLNKSSQLALFNQLKSGNIGSSGMTVNIGTVETPNAAEFMIDLQRIEAGRY